MLVTDSGTRNCAVALRSISQAGRSTVRAGGTLSQTNHGAKRRDNCGCCRPSRWQNGRPSSVTAADGEDFRWCGRMRLNPCEPKCGPSQWHVTMSALCRSNIVRIISQDGSRTRISQRDQGDRLSSKIAASARIRKLRGLRGPETRQSPLAIRPPTSIVSWSQNVHQSASCAA